MTQPFLGAIRTTLTGLRRFRWAQCQLDSIAQARTVRDAKARISTLPEGLDDTYGRILSQVPAAYVAVFLKALNWLAFAVVPLTLEQLWEAVAIERNTASIDEDSRLRGPHDVLELGKSLVRATAEGHVGLAHLSVRDYLLSSKIRDNAAVSQFALERREGSAGLAVDCLTYLFFEELRDGPSRTADEYVGRLKRLPMLKYAATAWPYHVKAAAAAAGGEVEHLVSRFFHPECRNNFMSWVQVLNADANFKWDVYPRHATPLYYASSFGLGWAVRSLLWVAGPAGKDDRVPPRDFVFAALRIALDHGDPWAAPALALYARAARATPALCQAMATFRVAAEVPACGR